MDKALFETLAQVAGIGGIALGVFLLVFRDVIRKNIFPNLTQEQAYRTIRLALILTFLIALAGLGAWIWSESLPHDDAPAASNSKAEAGKFRRVYYEGFDAGAMDVLALRRRFGSIWQVGKKSDWEGRFDGGVHVLCNVTGDSTASFTNRLRYYPTQSGDTPAPLGDSKITVKVRLEPPFTTHSGAGIRFRSVQGEPDYYAFVLNPGNNVSLMRRDKDKLRILWSDEISDPRDNAFATLKIVGDGSDLHLYVNDKLIHTETQADLLHGDPGIFAYSTGCFLFDDFLLSQRLERDN